MTTAYKRLAQLAVMQAELVSDGHLDQLEPIWVEQQSIVAGLPERPPAEARLYLEQAEAVTRTVQATLEAHLAETKEQLLAVGQGRRVAYGYGGGARGGGAVDARG